MHRLAVGLMVLACMSSAGAQDWQFARGEGAVDVVALQPAARRAQRIAMPALADVVTPAQRVRIDLFGRVLHAELTRFEARRDGWLWVGRIDESAGHFAQLTFHRGRLAGLISTAEGNYEVLPHPDGGSVLIDLDGTAFPPCGGAIAAPPVAADAAPAASGRGQSDRGAVDVMIVYTPPVLSVLGGEAAVEAHAQAAVDAANLAFVNSAMTLRFELVAVAPVDYLDSGSPGDDLAWLAGDAGVRALRDTRGADLVSMLVENGGGACGVGYVMRTPGPGFAESAFQVTARNCAVGNLTYAHEHGHNMGMEHDPANGTSPPNASYPWSFGHVVDGSYRTVMSYATECANGCPRRAYFSNPDIVYLGAPTGIAEQRDNHRTGNLVHPIVAAFRSRAVDTIFASGFDP